ncbi:MAG: YceD family protein, partial [Polymorphobacter sp.]
MSAAEFARPLRIHEIGAPLRHESLAATPAECVALAKRFDLIALDELTAELDVHRSAGAIRVAGRFHARGAQSCIISAEPVPFDLDDAVTINFSDGAHVADAEIELTDAELDELPLEGDTLDLGEIVAQSLALALDPWPR